MAKLVIWVVLLLSAAGSAFAQSASTKPPTAASRATAKLAGDQFTTEAAARAHCPGDTIVWTTLSHSKAYHLSGDRYYGKTRTGAYMCQKDADKSGMHQAARRGAPGTGASTGTAAGGKKSATGATH